MKIISVVQTLSRKLFMILFKAITISLLFTVITVHHFLLAFWSTLSGLLKFRINLKLWTFLDSLGPFGPWGDLSAYIGQQNTEKRLHTSIPRVWFEQTILVFEWATLRRAASLYPICTTMQTYTQAECMLRIFRQDQREFQIFLEWLTL